MKYGRAHLFIEFLHRNRPEISPLWEKIFGLEK